MCGRFSLRLDRHEIQAMPGHDLDIGEWIDEDEFIPRYNIAPRTQAPIIRRREPSSSSGGNDNSLIMQTMKWGLVPHWSKVEDKTLNTTNARSENLIEGGGMWASIKGKQRCVVPCQGYYEWLTKGKEKLPHFTKRKDGKLLLMAGLYDSVILEGKVLWTFTIVTTDANKEFSWLHDRQPVFLSNADAVYKWLDTSIPSWTPKLTEMVQPYSDALVPLECYPVPKEVGKVGTESPAFIEPIRKRKDGIETMFSKQMQMGKRKAESFSSPERSNLIESPKREDHAAASGSKRLKIEHRDDLNPKQLDHDIPEVPVASKTKTKISPGKKKLRKEVTPRGNASISSFFGKA